MILQCPKLPTFFCFRGMGNGACTELAEVDNPPTTRTMCSMCLLWFNLFNHNQYMTISGTGKNQKFLKTN